MSRRRSREELEDTIEVMQFVLINTVGKKERNALRADIRTLQAKVERILEREAKKNEQERFLHPVTYWLGMTGYDGLGTEGCYRAKRRSGAA